MRRWLERFVGAARSRVAEPVDLIRVPDVESFMPLLARIEAEARDGGDLRAQLARIRLETPELRALDRLDPFTPEMIPSVTGSPARAASASARKTMFFIEIRPLRPIRSHRKGASLTSSAR